MKSIIKISIDVDRGNFSLPKYIYNVPVIEQIPERSYEGKSLEEIENDYGKEAALLIYWCVCNGEDLTKIQPPYCATINVVDVLIQETDESLKVFLIANEYTEANENICILDVSFCAKDKPDKQRKKYMVNGILLSLFY